MRRHAPRSLLLTTLLLSGCWSLGDVPTSHIVMFDNQGQALDPSSNLWGTHSMLADYGPLEPRGFQKQLDGMFHDLGEWHLARAGSSPSGKKHVLV